MEKTQTLETKEIGIPRIVRTLFVHIDLRDDSERGSPNNQPQSMLTVYGTIDDFRLAYPLSMGAELTINKLPLGTVERVIIEDRGETLNIFAKSSGKVFIPDAKKNLADIAARYKALKLRVIPVGTSVRAVREIARALILRRCPEQTTNSILISERNSTLARANIKGEKT